MFVYVSDALMLHTDSAAAARNADDDHGLLDGHKEDSHNLDDHNLQTCAARDREAILMEVSPHFPPPTSARLELSRSTRIADFRVV